MKERINLFGDICRLIRDATSPQQTLDKMVEMIADRLRIDVCSVYIYEREKKHLVLRATVGLSRDSVGKISMGLGEGLTGLVFEKMQPLFVLNPATHDRYKYFEGSEEERYKTYLGLPLVFHQKQLGVMVIQSLQDETITESDIPFFTALASQISATVAYTGLLEDLEKEKNGQKALDASLSLSLNVSEPPPQTPAREKKNMLRGVPVSSGFAQGYARYLGQSIGFDQVQYEYGDDRDTETRRIENAFDQAEAELRELTALSRNMPAQDKAILDTHQMLLHDPGLRKQIEGFINQGFSAEYSVKNVVLKHVDFFRNLDDPYLRDRGADIEDIGKRVLRHLFGLKEPLTRNLTKDTILIAADISPVDLVALKQTRLKGIVLSKGGKTSHAVILAKSFEIPMIIGVREALDTVKNNDFLIVDGNSGLVFRKPPLEIVEEYDRLSLEKKQKFQELSALKNLRAETRDGYGVQLGANIGLISDMELVEKYGADYVGLYRTEFPFLVRREFPSEEEQFVLYKKIISGAGGRSVTIRTLDVGGDKFLSYLDYPAENNPYLGWRSVRVSLELDTVFRTQIRAILRASAFGKIKILFPMITSVNEIREIVSIMDQEKEQLRSAGISFDSEIETGIMVEVPAAVKILDRLLKYVDFASIGSNDLIQYTLAVDRNNEKVAFLYNPLHPAVIATIFEVAEICRRMNKPVGICGEAASNPKCAYLFVAMSIDQLSMNPASILIIKDMLRHIRRQDARKMLTQVLQMEDAEEISAFLEKHGIHESSPYA